MTENEFKFWAFICCSQQDNRGQRPGTPEVSRLGWSDWLLAALKTFSVPAEFVGQINSRGEIIPEQIYPIFQDEPEPSADANLSAAVRTALEQSRYLVVICSPRSAQNLQVNEVVRTFKQVGRGDHILPIVIAGEPHASDGSKAGVLAADECFVPALRHWVRPDGTVDASRRAHKSIFVDARHGFEKREILANDHRNAEADLEMAKIQLIAEVIGVAFNGLWAREQRRHFVDLAQAERTAQAALHQVEEARQQLLAAQQETRAAENKILEAQNLSPDVQGQIQAAQTKAQAAEDQARATQRQLEEFQNQARETQGQLEAARNRVRATESKFQEAQNQALEARRQADEIQRQLQAAQQQTRAAQNKILEAQNLAPDVQSQIEAAQTKIQAAEEQAREAQRQLEEFQNQARETQSQLEEARNQVLATESKFLAAQNQAEEARREAEAAQRQLQSAKSEVQVVPGEIQTSQRQTEEARRQVQELQNQARRNRRLTWVLAVIAVLALMSAGTAASIAWSQRKITNEATAKAAARAAWEPDLTQAKMDQEQILQALQKIVSAEQERNRRPSLDKLAAWIPTAEIPKTLKAAAVIVDDAQRSRFQKRLVIRLGWEKPLAAMTCASAIGGKIVNDEGADDSSRYFQLAVLGNWMQSDLPGAFNWVRQLPDADARDGALEKMIPALVAANPPDTLAKLNELKPAPAERIYAQFFEGWAATDPASASQQWQLISNRDPDGNILRGLLTAWVQQSPADAWAWMKFTLRLPLP